MDIDDLDTPAVLIDLDKVERNLARWQSFCDEHGLANRPHIKTHKLVEMTRQQLALGAKGIACQKLGEAEVMADHGVTDIIIPYNIVGAQKLERAVALAKRIQLTLACDGMEVAEPITAVFAKAGLKARLVIECDTGALRCGVTSPAAAIDLGKAIDGLAGSELVGLMSYPPPGAGADAERFFTEVRQGLRQAGLRCDVISNGGTPDMWRAKLVLSATEHRAGTYIYYDRMQVAAGAATFEDCALAVLATVVSRHGTRGAIDAGSKALSSDLGGLEGHGHVIGQPDLRITKLSEEHGHLELNECTNPPRIGERIRIIPNHACVVSNLFDEVIGVRGGRVQERFRVAARGRVL